MPDNNSSAPLPKVLIVDDNSRNRYVIRQVIKQLPVVAAEAESGESALELVAEHRFAAILLDVQMPGMDGYETASRIRELESCYSTPILFVTAVHTDSASIATGYGTGAVDYLFKPVDAVILSCKVKVFLQLYEQQEALRRMNDELQAALDEVKTLRGMVPICSSCKQIRDPGGNWHVLEVYLEAYTEADFTHSYCPSCMEKTLYDIRRPECRLTD